VPAPPPAGPCALVIFGAAGDLTGRLLMPAIYNLARAGLLPERLAIVGVDILALDADAWRARQQARLAAYVKDSDAPWDAAAWGRLAEAMTYLAGDFADAGLFARLAAHLETQEAARGTGGNALFYLAVADRFFADLIAALAAAGLTRAPDGAWRRVVVEKPFGHDLASARALNARILAHLDEAQVFRMDHFLGKETVRNILAFRFANRIFAPVWSAAHIARVEITAAETVGVEHRAQFYERTGALRDMVPNHLFQLLALVAMEAPELAREDAIRDAKAQVLAQVRCADPARDVVRAQYGAGRMGGQDVPGYRDEPGIAADSMTETYVALRLGVATPRWEGVPFFLRTGKRLARRVTEVAVTFRPAPPGPFADGARAPNRLLLRIQPDEGIALRFAVKVPGPEDDLATAALDFRYRDRFPPSAAVGYETLVYDCMIGDATLFQRADMVEAGWAAVQPVLEHWARAPGTALSFYPAGSEGPETARAMLGPGAAWHGLVGTEPTEDA